MCPYQGSKQNAHQEVAEHTQEAHEGVQPDRGHDIGSIDTEHCQPADMSTAAVV